MTTFQFDAYVTTVLFDRSGRALFALGERNIGGAFSQDVGALHRIGLAKAAVEARKSQDVLARTKEQIALNLRNRDAGAISELKVAEAVQNRKVEDDNLKQAEAVVVEALAGLQQAE